MPKPLSPRERQVVRLLAAGARQTEIARRLGVSPRTIETHIRNAVYKTGCMSPWELAVKAATGGIEDPPLESA
jgi:DNA-binding NarL/FixJ family response regulator